LTPSNGGVRGFPTIDRFKDGVLEKELLLTLQKQFKRKYYEIYYLKSVKLLRRHTSLGLISG